MRSRCISGFRLQRVLGEHQNKICVIIFFSDFFCQASDQSLSGRETSFKLPRTLEECQRKIISLQAKNAELQSRTQQNQNISGPDGTVQLPEAEYKEMRIRAVLVEQAQQQMRESDRLNSHLQETIQELRQGKVGMSCQP